MTDLDKLTRIVERLEADRFATDPLRNAIAELRVSRKVVEAAQNLVDLGREWIGGTKYCPECMAEGWHYKDCQSGQKFWELRKVLEDAVRAIPINVKEDGV